MVICQLMVAKALFEDFVLCIQIIPLPYIRYNENLSNNPIFFGSDRAEAGRCAAARRHSRV